MILKQTYIGLNTILKFDLPQNLFDSYDIFTKFTINSIREVRDSINTKTLNDIKQIYEIK